MMIRVFLLILLVFSAVPAHGLVVQLKPEAEVGENSVTLGDVGIFDEDTQLSRALADQPIAQSPAIGQSITLRASSIINRFSRSMDKDMRVEWKGADTIRVTRSATLISSARVLQIIDDYLQEKKAQLPKAKIRFIPAARPLPFSVPSGKLSWQVIPSDPEVIGSSRFSVIFSVDGRVRKNMSVHGRLEALSPVVVAAAAIRKGTILSPQLLAMSVQDLSILRDPCLDPQKVLGKKLTVTIKAGQPLALHQVESPPLVQRGELVRMVFRRGSLIITATGIARNNGAINQTIRVQNTQSQRTVYCRVAAPGVVEVVL